MSSKKSKQSKGTTKKKVTQKPQTRRKEDCCIHEDVMKKIHEDDITMRPKVYFVAGSALVGVGMAGAVLTSIFFTNVTLYKLKYDAAFEYLGLGASGFSPFIRVFPWVPFLIAAGGLIGGSHLLKQYDVSYKHRYKRIIIAFVALILTLGFLLEVAGTNKRMEHLKPFKVFYNRHESNPFVYGKVIQVHGNRAIVRTPYNEKVFVDLRFVPRKHMIREGITIRAIGGWEENTFIIRRVLVR